jgi:hypothetical protein
MNYICIYVINCILVSIHHLSFNDVPRVGLGQGSSYHLIQPEPEPVVVIIVISRPSCEWLPWGKGVKVMQQLQPTAAMHRACTGQQLDAAMITHHPGKGKAEKKKGRLP